MIAPSVAIPLGEALYGAIFGILKEIHRCWQTENRPARENDCPLRLGLTIVD
jgi:hypothetical protein